MKEGVDMQLSLRSSLGTTIAFLMFVACLGSAGCGKPIVMVSGNVSYQGKPLKGGTIRFVDATGRVASAAIDQNGNYTIEHAMVGEASITVETSSLMKQDSAPSYSPPPEYKGPYKGHQSGGTGDRYVAIPRKYESIETSDLKRVIKRGKNEFNFVLEGEVDQPLLPAGGIQIPSIP
jgi:hypothetical protein